MKLYIGAVFLTAYFLMINSNAALQGYFPFEKLSGKNIKGRSPNNLSAKLVQAKDSKAEKCHPILVKDVPANISRHSQKSLSFNGGYARISEAADLYFNKDFSINGILEIAKENGVTVLGTGINPGLIMDLLVIALTGACIDVEHIKAERVNSLSPFGHAVMVEQGVGITKEEFEKGKTSWA